MDAIAALIDHTLLKPEATRDDVTRVCLEARQVKFKSVCLNPCWVSLAARELSGSDVEVCTVIGFPLGANTTSSKLAEASQALSEGASELDVVQNIGALRSGESALVERELKALAALAHGSGALLKVILETCLLTDEQKRISCQAAARAEADFVKTSTGFSTAGATAADVALMRAEVAPGLGVKASGGVRTLAALREMVTAGATRIGSSSGLQILRELKANGVSPACQSQF